VTFIIRFFQILGVASLIVGSGIICIAVGSATGGPVGVIIGWLIWLSLLGAVITADL
jgi:hypothetical protein